MEAALAQGEGVGIRGASVDNLADLYHRHAAWLTRRLRASGVQAADDVVQETYLRIAPYQARGEIRHPKSLLLRIASSLVAEEGRRAQRRSRHATELSPLVDAPAQAETLLLKQLILQLPQPERDIFLFSRFEGLTNEQIAGRLEVSVKTVERRMTRALKQIDAQLRR
jgi:RNA polymerase sigma factor (sigma-70 family)